MKIVEANIHDLAIGGEKVRVLQEFMASNMDCVEIVDEKPLLPSTRSTFHVLIGKLGLRDKVVCRNRREKVFLVKTSAEAKSYGAKEK